MSDANAPPAFRFGRLVNWFVLVLLGVSVLYSLWIVLSNWKAITV